MMDYHLKYILPYFFISVNNMLNYNSFFNQKYEKMHLYSKNIGAF